MASRANRKRKIRVDEATRIARILLPAIQANRGGFQAVDVANHSETDQRHMVRSGEKRTIRKRSHVERLALLQGLDQRETAALQWYYDAHALRYETLNVVSSYGESGRCSKHDFDHLPSNAEQQLAAEQLDFARSAISPPIRLMFDRIVLQGWHVGSSTKTLFRYALNQLLNRIEGLVPLCD